MKNQTIILNFMWEDLNPIGFSNRFDMRLGEILTRDKIGEFVKYIDIDGDEYELLFVNTNIIITCNNNPFITFPVVGDFEKDPNDCHNFTHTFKTDEEKILITPLVGSKLTKEDIVQALNFVEYEY